MATEHQDHQQYTGGKVKHQGAQRLPHGRDEAPDRQPHPSQPPATTR